MILGNPWQKPHSPYKKASGLLATTSVWLLLQTGAPASAQAVEIEPMGKAIQAILGTAQGVLKKTVAKSNVFYLKSGGKDVVFIQQGTYEPNCTHTWAIGINRSTGAVSQIRVIEMSCQHAFPTKAASFLDQYKNKGPADVAKLDAQIETIAKATGSCKLTTDAVKRSITSYAQVKGKGQI